MTKQEYSDYEQAAAAFFAQEGIQNLSTVADEDGDTEPSFSWRSCDCCGSGLWGDRYDANGWNPTEKQVQEYSVCQDCIYYAEYGQLDDMTMLDVRRSEETHDET